jgi:hypothetical protein
MGLSVFVSEADIRPHAYETSAGFKNVASFAQAIRERFFPRKSLVKTTSTELDANGCPGQRDILGNHLYSFGCANARSRDSNL